MRFITAALALAAVAVAKPGKDGERSHGGKPTSGGCELSGENGRIDFVGRSGKFKYMPSNTEDWVMFSMKSFLELDADYKKVDGVDSFAKTDFEILCDTGSVSCPLDDNDQPMGNAVALRSQFEAGGEPVTLEVSFCLYTESGSVCESTDPDKPYTGTEEECAALTDEEAKDKGITVTKYTVVPDTFSFALNVTGWPAPVPAGNAFELRLDVASKVGGGEGKGSDKPDKSGDGEGEDKDEDEDKRAEKSGGKAQKWRSRIYGGEGDGEGGFTILAPDVFSCGGIEGNVTRTLAPNGKTYRLLFVPSADEGCGEGPTMELYYDPYVASAGASVLSVAAVLAALAAMQ